MQQSFSELLAEMRESQDPLAMVKEAPPPEEKSPSRRNKSSVSRKRTKSRAKTTEEDVELPEHPQLCMPPLCTLAAQGPRK
mmetsp:Transcript_25071/g.60684  ORF Transcript_25071/g.60684 Transcript_25071/m.60684 type:complete len:81 (-) Transcript_25071:49-291(-)